MTRCKRFFALFLTLALLCAMLPQIALPASADDSGSCGDGLTWEFLLNVGGFDLLMIKGTGAMNDYSDDYTQVLPPWYEYADPYDFYHMNSIQHVTIAYGVTSIGNYAFANCSSLTDIIISDSIKTIGTCAFRKCAGLSDVYIPASVTSIGDDAFADCTYMPSLRIYNPECEIIDASSSGHTLGNPDETVIHGYAGSTAEQYANKYGYTFTTLKSGTVYSGNCGAEGDGSNVKWTLDISTGVLSITGTGIMQGFASQSPWVDYSELVKSVVIGSGVKNVGDHTFYKCNHLTSVTIPTSVTRIEQSAFYECEVLQSITIPNGVNSIGESAFTRCYTLESVTLPDSVNEIGSGAFTICPSLKSIIIPDGVTDIEIATFSGCTALRSVTLPSSVTSIGTDAFGGCCLLSEVTIPSHVTIIGDYAFSGCDSLESVTIPESVKSVGEYTFSYCDALSRVTIPNSEVVFGDYAFLNCPLLKSVTIPEKVSDIGKYAFGFYRDGLWLYLYEDFRIFGKKDSTAETYANKYGIPFIVPGDTFVVSFDANGGTVSPAQMETGEDGSLPSLPTPVWAGHSFDGWFDAKNGGNKISTSTPFAKDTTVYAHWSGQGGEPVTFTDVSPTAYYSDAVSWAVNHTPVVTKGISATEFGPAQDCNRGQVVTFLWRAAGEPEPTSSVNPFVDVAEKDFYYKAVLWAVEKNVTKGMDETHFGPKQTCTRGQVVTFLWRAKGEPAPSGSSNPFVDVAEKDFYYRAVLWAVENGITKGTSTTEFSPKQTCTRGQVVTFLFRAVG